VQTKIIELFLNKLNRENQMIKRSHSIEEWKEKLTPEQFVICRNKGTERAFTGKYLECKSNGVYHCVCCGNALFKSETKFDSGTGWPSFWDQITTDSIEKITDRSHGMVRVEVVCKSCAAHLGHVFEDGPQPTGLRFCINSISLELKESS
jgi:peptide-methionine (R)-S-oxide reductase